VTDYRTAKTIGERIQAARKDRGLRTAADLAAAVPGGVVKESTIQNVEAGRKAELTVSQLLNISIALDLPPAYLLAPLGRPLDSLDLANLSDDFARMTVIEFDAWLSGNTRGAYRVTSAAEHRDRNLIHALRELQSQLRERWRLAHEIELEAELTPHGQESPSADTRRRLDDASRRISELSEYLRSSGLDPQSWAQ
jgi:transcriptional regulator with XRE-family HTH domain